MTGSQSRIAWTCLAVALIGLVWSSTTPFAQQSNAARQSAAGEKVSPQSLIPARAIFFTQCDGAAVHRQAYQQTAAYEAFEKSGLMPTIRKAFVETLSKIGPAANPILRSLRHIEQHGLSVAVSLPGPAGPPVPSLTVVLHEAAELERVIGPAIQAVAAEEGIEFTAKEVSGQEVTIGIIPVPNTPGIEVGWWTKGSHLVITTGINAVGQVAAVSSGAAENLETHPLWKKYGQRPESFTRTNLAWFELDL